MNVFQVLLLTHLTENVKIMFYSVNIRKYIIVVFEVSIILSNVTLFCLAEQYNINQFTHFINNMNI